MNFASELRNLLKAANLGAVPAEARAAEWEKMVQELFDLRAPQRKRAAPKKTPLNKMTDEEFIAFLKSEPAYVGIDIDRELGKVRVWCKGMGKGMSRMRVINWMNRADKTLTQHGRDKDARAASLVDRTIAPPHGWQEFMKEKQRDWTTKNGDQYDPPGTDAMIRNDFFGFPKEWREACRRDLGREGAA